MEEEFDLVECPDCAGMIDDPQYTCTTCWCEGGNGVLKVRRPTPLAPDVCKSCGTHFIVSGEVKPWEFCPVCGTRS